MIVVDMGNGTEELFQLLELCKFIYMPVCTDLISQSKLQQFENLLDTRGYSHLLEKTVKMSLPFCETSGNADYPESLIWSTLGNYVRELLGKETSHEQ